MILIKIIMITEALERLCLNLGIEMEKKLLTEISDNLRDGFEISIPFHSESFDRIVILLRPNLIISFKKEGRSCDLIESQFHKLIEEDLKRPERKTVIRPIDYL